MPKRSKGTIVLAALAGLIGLMGAALAQSDINPANWEGHLPNERLGFYNLFGVTESNFIRTATEANFDDPQKRTSRDAVFGHVIVVKDHSGAEIVDADVIPFCFSGQCNDPDQSATGIALIRIANGIAPMAMPQVMYVEVSNPAGVRTCLDGGNWGAPECYREYNVQRTFTPQNIRKEAALVTGRYHALQEVFNKKHPAEPGSIEYFAKHVVCDGWVTETKTFLDGHTEVSGRPSCRFVP